MELQELRALMVLQARLEPRVLLEQMELQDRQARQVFLGMMVRLGQLGYKAQAASTQFTTIIILFHLSFQ
jgi:hypothetical protein